MHTPAQTNQFETKKALNSLCPEGSCLTRTQTNQFDTKKAQYSVCSEYSCLTTFSKCTTNPSKLRRLAVSHLTIVRNVMFTVEESRSVDKKLKFSLHK